MKDLLKNLPIAQKFLYAFGVICLLCLLQGAASLVGLIKIDHLTRDLTGHTLPAVETITEMRGQMQATRRMELASLLCADRACVDRYAALRNESLSKYAIASEQMQKYLISDEERNQYQSLISSFETYRTQSDDILRQFNQSGGSDLSSIRTHEQQLLPTFNTSLDASVSLRTFYNQQSKADSAEVNHANQILRSLALSITIAVFLLCTGIGALLTRLIVPPVLAATSALEKLADKQLNVEVEVRSQDEIGRMSTALNGTVGAIRQVLTSVGQSAETLSAAAEELRVRAAETSGNTHTQTGKINQIAAAAQEMTATIGEISQNAEVAATSSRTSAKNASEGGAVMQNAAGTMQQIADATSTVADRMNSLATRSEEIGKIISVIQEISEQTNLLALNAAIEAARAGEHGRGFAVVAGEVRRLAERTKGATEEIATSIQSIQGETHQTLDLMSQSRSAVEHGLKETGDARSSLEAIITGSHQVEDQIHMIATAATQQTAASGEISESASQIAALATENAQASEETAEACKNLALLANDLDSIIRQYQLT